MFAGLLIALGAAFLTGYAVACLRYAHLRVEVDRLRARYVELVQELARLDAYPPPMRMLRGGRRR